MLVLNIDLIIKQWYVIINLHDTDVDYIHIYNVVCCVYLGNVLTHAYHFNSFVDRHLADFINLNSSESFAFSQETFIKH